MNFQQITADTLNNAAGADTLGNITFDVSRALEEQNIILPVIGYVVVFGALLFLFIIFRSLTKIIQHYIRKKTSKKTDLPIFDEDRLSISGELNAAIGLALYLHFNEAHDTESTVLTIKKVQKAYSPWSSKIYGLREYPRN